MTTSRLISLLTGLTAAIVLCSFLLFPPSYAQQPANDVAALAPAALPAA